MVYAYRCEACGEQFTVRATLAEKERGLSPRCPLCGSRNVMQDYAGVGIARSGGGSGSCCGPSRRGGCCG
jgi:putative FmdB family regulatory protein